MVGIPSTDYLVNQLRRHIGSNVDERILAYLKAHEHFDSAIDELHSGVSEQDVSASLLQHYRELASFGRQDRAGPTLQSTMQPSGDVRIRALSDIFAIDANRDFRVEAFRREVLRGRLMTRPAVRPWIAAQRQKNPDRSVWERVTLRNGQRVRTMTRGRMVDTLSYLVEDSPWQHRVVVPANGPLRQLKDLALQLVQRYGWLEAEASTFVLTGHVPLLAAHAHTTRRYPWPAASTVTLEVPVWMRTRDVAALYARASREAIPGRRRRDVTVDRVALATFAFEHHEGYTWSEAMTLWNRHQSPKRRFRDPRAFAKACHEAFLALTGEGLDWRGRGAKPSE